MVLVGIESGVVVLCVNINSNQLDHAKQMYPDWVLQEQVGEENIGWTFDGVDFYPPAG